MAIRNSANYKIGKQYNFILGGKIQSVTVLEKKDRQILLQSSNGMKAWFGWEHITIPQKSKSRIEQKPVKTIKAFNPITEKTVKITTEYLPKPPIVKIKPVVEELTSKISIPKVAVESDNYHYRLATIRKNIRDILQKHGIENSLNFQSLDKEYIEVLDKNLQKISKSLETLSQKS